jgi:hypothetical protein
VDKKFLIILFWVISFPLLAQEIVPKGHFHKDSVKIGEELPYSIWVRYPKDKDVAFPDSLFDFSPFELDKREYYTTKTDSLVSLDSAVYFFSTFEVDTVQYLQLPIFIINEFDSTTLLTSIDSIILDQVVIQIPDSVAVLVNTNYQKVPLAFNYPYFTIGLIIILVLGLIVLFVFGKQIKKSVKVFWIARRHKKFIKSFDLLLQDSPIEVEHTLSAWKKYLEKLLSQPYTKMTTKEIVDLSNETLFVEHLKNIDKYIYGGDRSENMNIEFDSLLQFAIAKYHNKIKAIKNG